MSGNIVGKSEKRLLWAEWCNTTGVHFSMQNCNTSVSTLTPENSRHYLLKETPDIYYYSVAIITLTEVHPPERNFRLIKNIIPPK